MSKMLLILLAVLVIVTTALAQVQDKAKATEGDKGKAVVVKTPAEVAVPEAREDKVRLLQSNLEVVELRQQKLIDELKASQAWKDLEVAAKDAGGKLQAELVSALKLAGVDEKDFANYKYDQRTLKFTRIKVEEPKKEK